MLENYMAFFFFAKCKFHLIKSVFLPHSLRERGREMRPYFKMKYGNKKFIQKKIVIPNNNVVIAMLCDNQTRSVRLKVKVNMTLPIATYILDFYSNSFTVLWRQFYFQVHFKMFQVNGYILYDFQFNIFTEIGATWSISTKIKSEKGSDVNIENNLNK